MKEEKKTFAQVIDKLKVKSMIKDAKARGIIKPHTEAFKKVPAEKETHKGNVNYFVN